jgi:peptidyl-prolyl cis-trans isomerase SurA
MRYSNQIISAKVKATIYSVSCIWFAAFWIGLCMPGMAQMTSRNVIDKVVGKVDNYILLKSEVENGILQAKSGNPGIPESELRCKVYEQLIINKLMLAKADIDSVTVESAMVEAELDQRMNYMINAIGGREKLEAYYKKTVEQFKNEFRKDVREQMLVRKMQDNITRNIKVTPAEVRRFFNDIPKDSLPFFSTEVEVGQILKHVVSGRANKQKAKEKLQEIRQRIIDGESFEFLAKAYSQDPGSAQDGGNLGFAKRGMMVPEYESAAMNLQPMELSEIVESAFGYHLIQLLEKRGNEYNSRHILIRPEPDDMDIDRTIQQMDSLRNAILGDSITFEKAVIKFSDDRETKQSGGYFLDPNTNSTRIPVDELEPGLFFTIDTMKVGTITRPTVIKTPDGKIAVQMLYYKARYKPHEANLKDDYQKIYNACLQKKRAMAIDDWFKKTKNEVYISIDPEYARCNILSDDSN